MSTRFVVLFKQNIPTHSLINFIQRRDLLVGLLAIVRPFGFNNLSQEDLPQLLIYGNKDFPHEINRNILGLILHFIHKAGRFD